jgi:hypothetical protein
MTANDPKACFMAIAVDQRLKKVAVNRGVTPG